MHGGFLICMKTYHLPLFQLKSLLIACLEAVAVMGPMFGYVLGSLCAQLYVDFGFVNTGKSLVCFITLQYVSCSAVLLFLIDLLHSICMCMCLIIMCTCNSVIIALYRNNNCYIIA